MGAVGGFVAKSALKQHTRQSYILTAGYAAVLFILGLVIVIMSATSYMVWNGTLGLLAGFALPVALMLSMFGPASQREAFRSIILMHLGGFNTFEALPDLVAGLQAKGLEPVTLGEMFGA